jgi:hypothetical protein
MSLSIQKLIGMLQKSPENVPAPEGRLYNPHIPDGPKSEKIQSRDIIKSKYMQHMKNRSLPRGSAGNYFRLPRAKTILDNPKYDGFGFEGAIDPNTIRRRQHPDSAIPNMFHYGSEGLKYELPEGAFTQTNGIKLLQTARKSYLNYKNRFAEEAPQPVRIVP